MAQRSGFQIPNAKDVSTNDLAEPDSGDFSILGNHRNGVVKGCDFTFDAGSGLFTVTSADNLVVRGGVAERIESSTTLTVTGSGPAFYLVVWGITASGSLGLTTKTAGVSVDNPVFPDLPEDAVVLASVYTPQTGSRVCIDKRLFLNDGLVGWVGPSEKFIHHQNGSGTNFVVLGDGTVQWGTGSDPKIYKSSGALRVNSGLTLDSTLSVSGGLTGTTGEFSGTVTASNLSRGSGTPSGGTPGDLYQRTDGTLYLHGESVWEQVVPSAPPVGTIISNISSTAPSGGWLAMGSTHSGLEYPDLWEILPSTWKDEATITFTLPSMSQRVLMGASSSGVGTGGSNSVQLVKANLPRHRHFDAAAKTGFDGTHAHSGSSIGTSDPATHSHTIKDTTGAHGHTLVDPGHGHAGVDFFGQPAGVVYAALGGKNKLDGPFNDSSHTYSVEVSTNIKSSTTGAYVQSGGGKHGHTVDSNGQHTHSLTIKSDGTSHQHAMPLESEVGGDAPVDTTPAHLTVYYYIKA